MHFVPQIAGVTAVSLVLADKGENEILHAHVLQAACGADGDMMALSPQHASDNENDLVARASRP